MLSSMGTEIRCRAFVTLGFIVMFAHGLSSSSNVLTLSRIDHPRAVEIEILPRFLSGHSMHSRAWRTSESPLSRDSYPIHVHSPPHMHEKLSNLRRKHVVSHRLNASTNQDELSMLEFGLHVFPVDDPVLYPTDFIRIGFEAFGKAFNLHLKPSFDILHPEGVVKYHRADGALHREESLLREAVMLFAGEVVNEEWSTRRLLEEVAGGMDRSVHSRLDSDQGVEGWARIALHDQGDVYEGRQPVFEGSFVVQGVMHHIVALDNYLRNRLSDDPSPVLDHHELAGGLVIYRDSDLISSSVDASPVICSHDRLQHNQGIEKHLVLRFGAENPRLPHSHPDTYFPPFWSQDPTVNPVYDDFPELEAAELRRRSDIGGGINFTSNFVNSIGENEGCPASQEILYMGVAADCSYVSHYGSVQNATANILKNWNLVSSLYKSTFNISLGIIELNIQDPTCPSTPNSSTPWNIPCGNTTLEERLSIFSAWRGEKGGKDEAGLWHLMTGCPSGTEIGVAWLGTVCQTDTSSSGSSVVSGTGVTSATRNEWEVIAHEIGHNFGAIHDCTLNCTLTQNCCPASRPTCNSNDNFLMSPLSETRQIAFSQCSLGNVCSLMQRLNTTCFKNVAESRRVISLQMCGNGIVEEGEDCDPGTGHSSPCCDPLTCKFTKNAQCDPSSSECCSDHCTFAPPTQACKPARDEECDIRTMCSGTTAECPSSLVDHTLRDGTPCGPGAAGLVCASGECTSNDQQCRTVGQSLNLTKACDFGKSCSVSCQDPNNPGECLVLQTVLIDGSRCGFGGSCYQGTCIEGGMLSKAKAWFASNKSVSVPLTVIGSILALLFVWSFLVACVRRCCCGRGRQVKDERLRRPPGTLPITPRLQHRRLNSDDSLGSTVLVKPSPLSSSFDSRVQYAGVPQGTPLMAESQPDRSRDRQPTPRPDRAVLRRLRSPPVDS